MAYHQQYLVHKIITVYLTVSMRSGNSQLRLLAMALPSIHVTGQSGLYPCVLLAISENVRFVGGAVHSI